MFTEESFHRDRIDFDDFIRDETVRFPMHLHRRLLVRRFDQAKNTTARPDRASNSDTSFRAYAARPNLFRAPRPASFGVTPFAFVTIHVERHCVSPLRSFGDAIVREVCIVTPRCSVW